MHHTPRQITEEDLHGFVDGEIDDDRRAAILDHLTTTPTDAARVEAWRQQNLLLRAAFSQVTLEQVPMNMSFTFAPRLVPLPPFTPSGAEREIYLRRSRRRSLTFTAAAFMAGACIALVANFSMNRYKEWAELSGNFGHDHGPALALFAASALRQEHQTATIPQTLLNLPGAVEPALAILPVLRGEGLRLLRGENRGTATNRADCLDFADAVGTPVVLCISAATTAPDTTFRSLAVLSANSVYWRESTSLYALAAPLESARLLALARHIHAVLRARQTP